MKIIHLIGPTLLLIPAALFIGGVLGMMFRSAYLFSTHQ